MAIPLTPVSLRPFGGQSIPTQSANTYTWVDDGSQAAYYIEYSETSSGSFILNTGWIVSSTPQHTFASGNFINTHEYKWRVRIRNSSGQISEFSQFAVFRGGNPVSLTITFPASEYQQLETLPTYTHSFLPLGNQAQYSYRYQVWIGATWDDWDAMSASQQDTLTSDEIELYSPVTTSIWDSGVVVSTATSVEQPSGYFITGEYWYKVRCTIVDTEGNSYQSDLRSFYILLDSVPKTPVITATSDSTNGQNIISITNSTPDPGQVEVAYNKFYRKKIDGTWRLLETNITSSTVYDRTCRSSKEEEYAVSAVGINGIEGGKSTSVTATCELSSFWFTNLTTNQTLELYGNIKWGQMSSERKREEYQPIDAVYPVVSYSPQRYYRGTFQAFVLLPSGVTSWPNYITQIRNVLDAGNQILMRSLYGDLFKLDIYDLQITPNNTGQYREISFNMVEVAEEVPAGTYTYETVDTSLECYWLFDPDTYKGYPLYYNSEWGTASSERQRFESIGLDSEMPIACYGNKNTIRSGFTGLLIQSGTILLAEEVMKFRELADSKNKKPLHFRTLDGDEYLVDVYGFSFDVANTVPESRKISFEFVEIGSVS